MKRFTFRLERLLKLRRTFEREQAKTLGRVIQAEERERENREQQEVRHAEARRQLAELSPEGTRAGLLVNLERSVRAIGKQADAARETHRRAVEQVTHERERYTEVRKDRRTLERLREKKRADWETETTRQEQAAIDEVAARQSSSSSEGEA